MSLIKAQSLQMQQVKVEIDHMNTTVIRQVQNQGSENRLLDRELQRMQHMDRVKVAHVRNSLFVRNKEKILPSLDLYTAQTFLGSHDAS